MEILKNQQGTALNLALVGRLDTTTAPQLEAELNTAYENVAATWISEQADTATAQAIYDHAVELVAKYA